MSGVRSWDQQVCLVCGEQLTGRQMVGQGWAGDSEWPECSTLQLFQLLPQSHLLREALPGHPISMSPTSYPVPSLFLSLALVTLTAGDFIVIVHKCIPRLGRVGAGQIFAECMITNVRPQSLLCSLKAV